MKSHRLLGGGRALLATALLLVVARLPAQDVPDVPAAEPAVVEPAREPAMEPAFLSEPYVLPSLVDPAPAAAVPPPVAPEPVIASPDLTAPASESPPAPLSEPLAPPPALEPVVVAENLPESLEQVLRTVFASHPQVQQAISEVDSQRYAISGARAGYFPFLQVQSAVADKGSNGSTTVSVVQPLWDGGLTSAQLDEAKQRYQAAFANLTQVRLTLSQDVLAASFDILGADSQLTLWDQYIVDLNKSLETIQRRSERGVSPEADVQTALVRVSQAESGREAASAVRISGRSRLSSLMSQPPPPLRWPEGESRLRPDDLPGLLERVEAHPTMEVDRLAVRVQEAIAKGTRASLWPSLSLQHREQLEGTRFDPSSDATLLVAQYQTTNGLKAYQGARSEKAKVAAAESRVRATRANLQAQVRSDSAQLLALATQIAAQTGASNSSTALVDSYRRQFEVGRKTWVELLNAQREAHEARIQLANLTRAYWQVNLRLMLQAMHWERLGLGEFLDPGAASRKP